MQREGAIDPRQHGRTAPLLLPKKELGRFLQRIADTDKHARERAAAALAAASARAARAAAAATDAQQARAAAAQVEMVPAGTRRACFHAGMSYVRDKVSRAPLPNSLLTAHYALLTAQYYSLLTTHHPHVY